MAGVRNASKAKKPAPRHVAQARRQIARLRAACQAQPLR